jgi:hypothetical protein
MRISIIAIGLAVWLFCGCDSGQIKRCDKIPAEGCPVGRGGTCDDATCAALYNCVDGQWVLHTRCDVTTGTGGSGGTHAGGAGAGGCDGIVVDRTGEQRSCSPPLQNPDCPAGAAELCRPCQTGCVDFFLCREGGWESVAFCDEDGRVVPEP